MDWWNLFWTGLGAVGGTFGALAGLAALVQTRKANKLAEDANGLAEKANGIAADSKTIAENANRLAAQANQISADANTISQRALRVAADQTTYEWRLEFDYETSTVFLINDCPHEATNVQVFIRHENETVLNRIIDHATAFGEIPLEDQLFTQKIIEDQRSIDAINADPSPVFFPGPAGYAIDVRIAYTTELGSRRTDEIKQTLSHGKRH